MNAVETAMEGLRNKIASGELAAGQKCPPEAELSAQLGVSRSSLREAVRAMSALGVMESRHGSGTYVSSLDPTVVLQNFALLVDLLPLDRLLELFEIRRLLESHAAATTAANATPEDLTELMALVASMEAAVDPTEYAELDSRFHEAVCRAKGNSTLSTLVRVFRSRGDHFHIYDGEEGEIVRANSTAGHRAIASAIVDRDPTSAATAMAAHIAQTESLLKKRRASPRSQN
ncbi:FCD domain-containing protein [Arthrobacter sp. AK01]|uniref:FadR/GntR family transcriptional regulator n=1 Tax=Micrococcaceae TaxID=1268 RepID=UPI001E2EDB50|nr:MULTISPECIES: FCD domain-containing protein [Micrococcaceae]MCD4852040.1 FCD domain-containing protein [Arthrobacter sp. AK01]MCP1413740.1 DNA-binding FadR family transcriptional regulator [Paenarthrobacter sp. A20]